jgi:hypothetical protein
MTVIVEKITKKEAKLLAYEEKDLEIKKDIRILNQ